MSIEDRLDRLERERSDRHRPWYKRASDVFSLLAVGIAAVSIVISLISQSEQAADEDRRHLSAVFNEIGNVNTEMARLLALPIGESQKEFAKYALNNQLWALLQDAGRLAEKFKNELEPLELLVLGAGFAQISELDRAERHIAEFLQADVSPVQRAAAYRSLASLIVMKGRGYFGAAHDNFRKAIAALEGTTSVHAGLERANTHILQARIHIAEQGAGPVWRL